MRRPRPARSRGKPHRDEDLYKADPAKSATRNACDALRGACTRGGGDAGAPVSDARRLSCLNALVDLLLRADDRRLGFDVEELLCCLRIGLIHESTQVRAGTLRVIRYVLQTEADVVVFNSLRLSYLLTRSLDVVLHNEMERVQALKVVRRLIRLNANLCEPCIVRALVAVPGASPDDRDRMLRAYLAVLCELGILNPHLFIHTGGVAAITRAILDCQTPRIAESLCGVLLFLLNDPKTRLPAKVDLRCLAAPYCDFHYRHGWMDKNRDEREMRFTCSRLSLLSILRSWPGLLHFCDPHNESGLRAVVDILYLNQLEVRKAILDLLYELLGLPQPDWTDELSVALSAIDPSDFQDSWRLNEGFVAAEGKAILPHLSATGPNLAELHLALLLYCFLEVGLLDALAEVMITSDTFISVRATVLLGQLLHLVHLLLPPEICNISPALPTLLSRATANHPQALAAVAALQNLNSLLKTRPASHSLFLDHILQYCNTANKSPPETGSVRGPPKKTETLPKRTDDTPHKKTESAKQFYNESLDLLNDDDYESEIFYRSSFGSRSEYMMRNESALIKSKSAGARTSELVSKVVKSKKLFNWFDKDSDLLIKNSNVFEDKMGGKWNWEVIRTVLKNGAWGVEKAIFVKKLVHFIKPSSNMFSHTDLQQSNPMPTRFQAQTALELVGYLLGLQDPEGVRLLTVLFTDIRSQIAAITLGKNAHDCLFSPQHMANTMCQMYFLLIGRLCSTQEGLRIFKDTGLYDSLNILATSTHHSCYVKLIISSLDYSLVSYPRQILTHTLRCNLEASRLYATQFLNVLIRARQKAGDMNNKLYKILEPNEENSDLSISQDNNESFESSNYDKCSEMDAWILELLVKQSRDESKAVSLCALNILDEVCNVKVYLYKLVQMKPCVKDLGDKGYLLWIRFASTPLGFKTLSDAGYVHRQIRYWATQYNYRYIRIVEGDIHDCLTLLQRSEDGRYSRRHSSVRTISCRGTPLPPHLYAQLVLHKKGVAMLAMHADIPKLILRIKQGLCSTEQEIMDLKAALWACGNIATSSEGIKLFTQSNVTRDVFAFIIHLAQHCQVYSIRGTAFYVLGLIGSCYDGANILHELGWLSVRHNRHDRWPIIKEAKWLAKSDSETQIYQNLQMSRIDQITKSINEVETSESSIRTDHSNVENSQGKNSVSTPIIEHVNVDPIEDSTMLMSESLEKLNEEIAKLTPINESSKSDKALTCHLITQRGSSSKNHQRSLSESKTLEKLRIDEDTEVINEKVSQISTITENRPFIGRFNSFDQWQEGIRRIRNYSESSTSGVSSCDSVLGKYVISDRIATLSPIPSSSSLTAVKNSISSRRTSETVRRISLHSCTGSDVTSSPPSQRDLFGYDTLRYLGRHRRPTYSDASVDEIGSLLDSDLKRSTFGSVRIRNRSSDAKHVHTSLFKHDWKPIGVAADSKSGSPHPNELANAINIDIYNRKFQPSPMFVPPGPCYIGISMPRCLLDIFPSKNCYIPEESSEGNYVTGDDSLAYDFDSHHQDTGNKRNDDSNFNSSFSDLSIGNDVKPSYRIGRTKSRDRIIKHDQSMCLICSRLRPITEVRKTSDLREAFFAGMDSPKPSNSNAKATTSFGKSPAPTSSLTYVSLDISCGSPTSLDSNLSKLSDSNPNVVGEILKHSERMGNPVLYKQSTQTLLGLKQKYPEAFQSVCLYSEICKVLSHNTYRLNARRFVQELFLDLNFDSFHLEPQMIIQNKLTEIEASEK